MTDFRIQVVVDPANAVRNTRKVRDELEATEEAGDSLNKTLKNAFQVASAGLILRELAALSDTWTDLSSRVRIATGSQEAASETMDRLSQIARRTYSDLSLTAESFLLNSTSLRELGYNTQQQLDFTESLNNALVVSGAKGDRARSVTEALSKAMALGTLQGDNLNTVISTGGRVAEALAAGLGVTTNELRKLGAEGKLTSTAVFGALTGEMEKLRAEAESMPVTVADSFVILGNAALQFVGQANESTGATSVFASGVITLSEHLDIAAAALAVVATGVAVSFIPAATLATFSVATLTQGFLSLTAAMLANPFALVAAGIAAIGAASILAIDYLVGIRDEIRAIEAQGNDFALSEFGKIGDDILRVRDNLERVEAAMAASNGGTETQIKLAERYRAQIAELTGQQEALANGTARNVAQAQEYQKAVDALAKSVTEIISGIEQENALLALNSRERSVQAELLKQITALNKGDGPDVTEAQKAQLEAAIRNNQALREQANVLDQIRGPQEQFRANLAALDTLLANGSISATEYQAGLAGIASSAKDIDLSALGVSGGSSGAALAQIQASIAATKEQARQESLRAGILDQIRGPTQQLADTQAVLRDLLAECAITQEEYNTATAASVEAFNLLNPAYAAQKALLEEIVGPTRELEARQAALDALFVQGAITAAQYEAELVKIDAALHPLTETQQAQKDLLEELNGPTEALRLRQENLNALYAQGAITAAQYAEETKQITEALHPLNEQQQLQADILESIRAPQEQFLAVQDALNALLASGAISAREYAIALNEATIAANTLGSDASTGLAAGMAQIKNELLDTGGLVQQSLVNGFHSAEDALVSFVTTGKADFGALVDQILADLARLAIRQAITGLFGGGGEAGLLSGIFGGARAEGGDVDPSKSYLVGENGPELYTPEHAGNITPAGETAALMRGPQQPTVNVNVPPANLSVINVRDPAEIPSAIESTEGAQAVMNVLGKNRQTAKGIIG